MLKGLGSIGDMAKMMKAAQEMQGRLAEVQEELGRVKVTGEAGAGVVRVHATAKGEITGVEIDPTILHPSQKEVVEDLILAALRDAQLRGHARMQESMQRLAEEMGLPPGTSLPV